MTSLLTGLIVDVVSGKNVQGLTAWETRMLGKKHAYFKEHETVEEWRSSMHIMASVTQIDLRYPLEAGYTRQIWDA